MASIGVLRERAHAERRVALTPEATATLTKAGHTVTVETGAGVQSGFTDDSYVATGATVADLERVARSDLVVAVRGPATHAGSPDPGRVLGAETTIIALFDPLWLTAEMSRLAETGATVLALELVPRITRAQSMDVLSSTASVAGYEAVVLAASRFGRSFPLMMTAAGTLPAAKVLVLGAGVAGLAAIATARRLGAVVSGYDVREAAAEQIESLGARAIRLDIGTEGPAEGSGGYARAQTDDENRRRREALAEHVAASDVVITTAAIPGRASPLLITTEMIAAMQAGSVVVDLAAARGGNCEPTVADAEIDADGVLVLGPTDLASRSPIDASSMFATNVVNLIEHMTDASGDGEPNLVVDPDDEITGTLIVARDGQVVHPGVAEALAANTEPADRP